MNYQFESKMDGPQRITSHMTKTFFDILSDPLQIRTKSLKETDSHYNPIRTRRPNPTRSRLPQSIQKEIGSPQTKERGNNSQKTKNYRCSKAFHSRKMTSIQKFATTIAKFSWFSFQMLPTEGVIRQLRKAWTMTNSSLDRRQLKQQQPPAKIHLQESQSQSI